MVQMVGLGRSSFQRVDNFAAASPSYPLGHLGEDSVRVVRLEHRQTPSLRLLTYIVVSMQRYLRS